MPVTRWIFASHADLATVGINPYHQPLSKAIVNVPAGASVTAEVCPAYRIHRAKLSDAISPCSGIIPSIKPRTILQIPLMPATRDP